MRPVTTLMTMTCPSKRCFKCGEEKPLAEFYVHSRMADGHLNKCKACARRDTSLNYHAKRSAKAEYERRRQDDPDRRKNKAEYQRKYRSNETGRLKSWARCATRRAIASGLLVVTPCEACGAKDNLHAHHDDYRQPLRVHFLCFGCHMARHGKTVVDGSRRSGYTCEAS